MFIHLTSKQCVDVILHNYIHAMWYTSGSHRIGDYKMHCCGLTFDRRYERGNYWWFSVWSLQKAWMLYTAAREGHAWLEDDFEVFGDDIWTDQSWWIGKYTIIYDTDIQVHLRFKENEYNDADIWSISWEHLCLLNPADVLHLMILRNFPTNICSGVVRLPRKFCLRMNKHVSYLKLKMVFTCCPNHWYAGTRSSNLLKTFTERIPTGHMFHSWSSWLHCKSYSSDMIII